MLSKKHTINQELPIGWEMKNLLSLVDLKKGISYKGFEINEKDKGSLFLTLKSISKQGGFNKDSIKFYTGAIKRDLLLKPGDILIANTDLTRNGDVIGYPLSVPYVFKEKEITFSMDLSLLQPNEKLLSKEFLYYYLMVDSVRKFMKSHSSGSTVLHLQTKALNKLQIGLPPLNEQKKITLILTSIHEAIEQTEAIIKQNEKVKIGLIQHLLTKGIGHSEFKETEMGEIPKKWEVKSLEEIVEFSNGKAHEKVINENGKYIVVNSKFISSNGTLYKRTDSFNSPLEKGQITMVMSDVPNGKALAKCFYIEENNRYTLNQRICSFKPEKINGKYLYYFLNRNKYFLSFDNGVGQTNLRKNEVLECPVLVPPIQEQIEIVNVLDEINSKIEIERQRFNSLQIIKRGLMQNLLTGKVRVQVDDTEVVPS